MQLFASKTDTSLTEYCQSNSKTMKFLQQLNSKIAITRDFQLGNNHILQFKVKSLIWNLVRITMCKISLDNKWMEII